MLITNTTFKLPKRRLYTWKSPADNSKNIVRNQIDYLLIRRRFRNAVKSVKTYPGADVSSDHNPVVANIKIKLKKVQRKKKTNALDTNELKNEKKKAVLKNQIQDKLKNILTKTIEDTDVNNKWKNIQEVIMTESKQHLKSERRKKKGWMTEEIMELMEKRRKYKNVNE